MWNPTILRQFNVLGTDFFLKIQLKLKNLLRFCHFYLLMWLGFVNSDVHKIIPSWNLFLLALFKSLKAFSWNTDQRYKYPSELKFKSVSKPWLLNQSRISASKNSKIINSRLIVSNFQRKTLFLKIRKSQKQIVVSSILPKMNQKICQILP